MRAIAIAIALLTASAAYAQIKPPVDADAPQITTTPGKEKVALGEPFQVFITVLHKPDMKLTLPAVLELGESWTELGARNESHTVEKDGTIRHSFVLTVGALEVGTINFPGLPLGYEVKGEPRQIQTSAFTVEVASTIGEAKEELRPAASPVVVTERDYTLAWAAGGVVAAGLLGVGFWIGLRAARRRRHDVVTAAATEAQLPPAEAALARLRALAGRLESDAALHPVYFELAEIVRQYVGARWAFDALEQTSEELLASLRPRAPEAVDELGAWLSAADLVKYARVAVDRATAQAALAQAVAFVERTRPVALPAPTATTTAPAEATS